MAEIDRRKASLIAEIEVSRGEMRRALQWCEASLNPAEIVRKSVKARPAVWTVAAAVSGLALSRLLRFGVGGGGSRGTRAAKTDQAEPLSVGDSPTVLGRLFGTRMLMTAGRVVLDLARPALLEWATAQVAKMTGTGLLANRSKPGTAPKDGGS